MKSLKVRLSALVMLIILLAVTVLPSFAASQPTKYSSSSNSGTRDVVCTTLNGTTASSYYTGSYSYDILSKQSSSDLFNSLQTLMRNTHSHITSYGECQSKASKTDCQNNDGTVVLLYTSYEASMSDYAGSGSVGWNREHVWPKSLGGDSTSGGGADLHHIRPDDYTTNGTRGNKKFGNVSGGSQATGGALVGGMSGGTYSGNYFEPHDNVKGDVARICLYVYTRWNSSWGASSITKVFQSVDVLLEWCALDPVDTWEMGRNEVVYSIQGNRNVFIDYPEYAWLIFGRSVPAGMQTPSGKASGSTGGGSGGGDSTCSHSATMVTGKVDATCGTNGYTGDTYCSDCGVLVIQGRTVTATGNHTFSAWTTSNTGAVETRTCSTCKKTETRPVTGTNPDTPTPSECTHSNTEIRGAIPCGEEGGAYTGDTYCTDCGELVREGSHIPMSSHMFEDGAVVVEPTETSSGLQEQTCIFCGEKNVKTVPSLNSAKGGGTNTVTVVAVSAGGVGLLAVALFLVFKKKV